MILTHKQEKAIVQKWGWKRLPSPGREYIHVSMFYNEVLINEQGIYHLFYEDRK